MTKKLRSSLILFFLLCSALAAVAQQGPSNAAVANQVLRPPKGANVALVVFEDMQCPDCGRAEPVLQEAISRYKIPLVRYDFPLPQHDWSFEAHVIARYFDTRSKEIGEKFRTWLFSIQPQVTKANLRSLAEKFAQQNGGGLPFIVDPKGEFAAAVNKDKALGNRLGVSHTPTIYVVSNSRVGQPFVEVADRRELFGLIERMQKQAGTSPASASGKKTGRTGSKAAPKKD